MRDRKLAARYARALLSVLPDFGQAETTDGFLTALARLMNDSEEFRSLMLDPAFSRAQRKAVLVAVAEAHGQPKLVVNFLKTLVDNNRTSSLRSIAAVFHEVCEEAMGVIPAEMVTATPLAADQRKRAAAAMERMTGATVRLTCRVDPALIGGAVTRIGGSIYDGSLLTQLGQLRRKMIQE